LLDSGELERLQNFWLTGACQDQAGERKTHSVPLGIENFISAFGLLAGGIVGLQPINTGYSAQIVGILILGCEYLYVYKLSRLVRRCDKRGWLGLISMVGCGVYAYNYPHTFYGTTVYEYFRAWADR
jgi:ionotropic glutamate receptor NMDA 2B